MRLSLKTFRILAYHALRASNEDVLPPEWSAAHAVSVDDFRRQLGCLRDGGWQTVLPAELETSDPLRRDRLMVLTFDDGHKSDLTAAELLAYHGYRAIFYISPARIESASFLARADVKNISAQGFGIGSHGLTHSRLTEHSEAELWRELRLSKELLEDLIGKPVRDLAVPFGRYDRRVIEIARTVGYERIMTSNAGLARFDRLSVLPRLTVTSRTTQRDFEQLLSLGAIDIRFLRYTMAINRRLGRRLTTQRQAVVL